MMRLHTQQDAARFVQADLGGEWVNSIYECVNCGAAVTQLKKCRAKMRSRCRRLAGYHVHHVCFECGYVWVTDTWRL